MIESQEANRRAQDPTPPGNSLNDLVPSESHRQEMIQIQEKKGHFCSRSEAHPTGQAVAFEPVTTVLLFIAIGWIGGLMWNSSRQIRSHVYGLVQDGKDGTKNTIVGVALRHLGVQVLKSLD